MARVQLRAGTRWTSWLGAAALVIAAALFVKHAIHEGWLGPGLRLALGTACGLGLIIGGLRAARATMRPLAHALFGAGLGVLYVSVYVAFASHGLIPRELAVGAMITVTVAGCALAVWFDAQSVAVFALLGGLLTPIAVASGGGSRDELFTYLLVLDIGVVGLATLRRWRALEWIAVIGTWILFAGWLVRHHVAADWRTELAWLAGFHALFLILPFGYHLRRSIALAPGRFTMAIVNAAAVTAGAAMIVDGQRNVLGIAALVMAATYHALGAIVRRRLPGDGRAQFGFVAFAVVYATGAVPLLLRDHGITLAWSLEAPVLLALGFHYRHFPIRLAGLGVLALAAARLLIAHWPLHPGLSPFLNLEFVGAMAVPLAALAFTAVHHALRRRGDERDRWLGVIAAVGGGALALVLIHAELAAWLAVVDRAALARAVVPTVWAAGAVLALAIGARRRDSLGVVIGGGFAVVAAGLAFRAYQLHPEPEQTLAFNARFGGGVSAALAAVMLAIAAGRRDREWGRAIWIATLAGLGGLIGSEAYFHYVGPRAQTAITIAWAGYAAALLGAGFVAPRRALRLAGLGLLGVVAGKLVLVDLAGAAPIHRVVSFLLIGTLMIVASYAYHRLERR